MIVSDRELIVAALDAIRTDGPAATGAISWRLRESGLPHRADRLKTLLGEAAEIGVARLQPKTPGRRSRRWEVGSTPLPDWFGRGPKPEPEPAVEPPADINAALGSIVRCLREIGARLDAIDGKLDDLAADTSSRPLFARRNGH